MTNRIEYAFELDGFVDEIRYYRSLTMIDINNLPPPTAVLDGSDRTFVDDTVTENETYHVIFGSYRNGVEKLSAEITVFAADTTNVVSLLLFDNDFTDVKGKIWTPHGGVSISGGAAVFVTNGALESQNSIDFAYGTRDFELNVELELNSITANQYIIDHGGGNAGALSYYQNSLKYYNPTTGVGSALYTTSMPLSIGIKYAVKVKRVSGVTSIYVNDVLKASAADAYNYTAQKVWLGRYPAGTSQYLNGKMHRFEIKKF